MEEQNQFQNQMPGTPAVTVGEWIVTMLITAIPLVGLIMLFVWAFGGGANLNKSNWAKAALIWAAIVIVLYVFIFAIFGLAMFRSFS
jgi:hypothetical protein